MARYQKCKYCGGPLPREPDKFNCLSCGQINLPGGGPSSDASEEIVIMSKVPERTTQEKRYDVGVFNDIFGSPPGLSKTCVTMIGGRYGAGKTTLFLQLADKILEQVPPPRVALYVAYEQSDEELKDFGSRLKLKHWDRIAIYNALSTGLRRPMASIVQDILGENGVSLGPPCYLVFDSLTRAIGRDYDMAEPLVANMKELSVQYRYPTMIVNQLNKDMEHAGKMEVPHAVDIVMGLDLDERTKQRLLFSQKNRMGPSPMEMKLRMMDVDSERPGYLVPEEEYQRSEHGRINPNRKSHASDRQREIEDEDSSGLNVGGDTNDEDDLF
jgi:predicted ATP-dependent serine protease